MTAHVPPQAPPQSGQQAMQPPQPPTPPWTPFQPKLNDSEPLIAALWVRKLSRVMSTVKYDQQPPLWRQPFDEKYNAARNAVAAVTAPPPLPHGVSVVAKTGAGDVGQAEQAAMHPGAAPQGQPQGQQQPQPPGGAPQ
jgi:hypothetical protein